MFIITINIMKVQQDTFRILTACLLFGIWVLKMAAVWKSRRSSDDPSD
jgi:hypothetical protein